MRRVIVFISGVLLICSLAGNLLAGEIHEAAKIGDLERIKTILEADKSRLYAQDMVGYTALHWAAVRAQWDAVKYLIEAGADVNAFGLDGNTPLHSVANHNNVAIIGSLIKNGSIVDKKNNWGETPLHIACQAGNSRVATILVFQGANIHATSTKEGWTPLHYAQLSGHTKLAGQLKRQGASLEYLDSDGKNADEIRIRRPDAIDLDPTKLDDFIGKYSIDGKSIVKVWLEDGKLWVEEYGLHLTYPIGVDSFYCEKQPWTISYGRDKNGKVDRIYLGFLRQTVSGVKVSDDFKLAETKSKFGLTSRPLLRFELTYNVLKDIYRLETPSDTVAALVTFVMENSPADKAGIRQRDIILMFNNDPVMNSADLNRFVEKVEPGSKISIEILRREEFVSAVVNF